MKTHTNMLVLALVTLFVALSAGYSMAYQHDSKGWIDDHHQHHPFVKHNGHRGYWDHDKHGAKVFITV